MTFFEGLRMWTEAWPRLDMARDCRPDQCTPLNVIVESWLDTLSYNHDASFQSTISHNYSQLSESMRWSLKRPTNINCLILIKFLIFISVVMFRGSIWKYSNNSGQTKFHLKTKALAMLWLWEFICWRILGTSGFFLWILWNCEDLGSLETVFNV